MEYYIWAVLLVAVLYAMYQSQSKTDKTEEAIVMDAPNLEFGYPQPADVLAYEGETLVTENDRQELLQYFAKQAYDWHKGYFIKRNDLLGHFSRNFVELAGMAGEY